MTFEPPDRNSYVIKQQGGHDHAKLNFHQFKLAMSATCQFLITPIAHRTNSVPVLAGSTMWTACYIAMTAINTSQTLFSQGDQFGHVGLNSFLKVSPVFHDLGKRGVSIVLQPV